MFQLARFFGGVSYIHMHMFLLSNQFCWFQYTAGSVVGLLTVSRSSKRIRGKLIFFFVVVVVTVFGVTRGVFTTESNNSWYFRTFQKFHSASVSAVCV